MNRHLVAVKVRIVCGADKGMKLYRPALNQNGFKCLNAEPVQRGCTVEKNGMILDNIFENIPNLGLHALDHALCGLDIVGIAKLIELFHDKGLEQLQCHLFGKTALVHLEFGAHDDNGTAGIVNTFAEQVLAETSLFAAQHIGKGLQRAVAGTRYRAPAPAVVDKCIHSFLKHALFVANNDVRCAQLKQPFKAVVAVDDPSVKVVKVACRKPSAVQLNHGADFRRNNRNNIHYDPFGLVSALYESFDDFKAFNRIHALLSAGICDFFTKLFFGFFKIELLQKLLYGLCTHARFEALCAVITLRLTVFNIGEQLLVFKRGVTGIGNDECNEVKYLFKIAGGHVQQHFHAARYAFEVPDMGYGSRKFDMAHALSAHLCSRNFNTALFADNALVAHPLISSAVAFPVLRRSENTFAEEAVRLGFKAPVVYGFGFFNFTVGPFSDLFGGCKTDSDCIEICQFKQVLISLPTLLYSS